MHISLKLVLKFNFLCFKLRLVALKLSNCGLKWSSLILKIWYDFVFFYFRTEILLSFKLKILFLWGQLPLFVFKISLDHIKRKFSIFLNFSKFVFKCFLLQCSTDLDQSSKNWTHLIVEMPEGCFIVFWFWNLFRCDRIIKDRIETALWICIVNLTISLFLQSLKQILNFQFYHFISFSISEILRSSLIARLNNLFLSYTINFDANKLWLEFHYVQILIS